MHFKRLVTGAIVGLVSSGLLIGTAWAASNNIIVTYAGNGTSGFSGDGGPAASAKISYPSGVVLDNAANVFFADTHNQRIRKVTANTTISTVAGNGTKGYKGDGGPATSAELNYPTGVARSFTDGTLYIADTGNNRIRKVSPTGTITTYAGTGQSGYTGDTGGAATKAMLSAPTGLAVDTSGNLFIADTGNNVVREVVAATGNIVTIAGTGKCGLSGNSGPATKAKLCAPSGVAVSGTTVLISDTANSQVRKVSGGTITAFAGTGSSGFSGDGGQAASAKISAPLGVSEDPLGDVYIVDAGNARIRQVDASGKITTFAGIGSFGYSGDGGPAELAKIAPGGGISAEDASNVFFGDTFNQRVRRIHKNGPPPALPEAQNILLGGSAILLLGGGSVVMSRRKRQHGLGTAAA
jgi:hypothetical protein